ncbi:hypothetical protein BDN71DRAFT_1445507, partial [Pleurotus eryngii]
LSLQRTSQWTQPRTCLFSWKKDKVWLKEYNGQRSVHVHIRTLSSGDPHSLAQNSLLTFDIPPYTKVRAKTNYMSRMDVFPVLQLDDRS